MSSRRFMMAMLPLLAACGSPGAAPDGGAQLPDSALTPPLPLPFYEVPVDDPALAAHAFFAVPDVHYVVEGGVVTLTYDFPLDLSGIDDQEVVLTGPVDANGGATVSGPLGSGTCEIHAGVGRCVERFTALPLDPSAARAMAAGYSSSADAVSARRAVIDRFVSDPIGIVVFDLAAASEPTD